MPDKLLPDQYRQPGETLVQWANRLRVHRGVHGLEWYEQADGSLALRPHRHFQSNLNF